MKKSKNFNLFLMDGEVTGRIKCTLLNWTGLAYKVPRAFLDKCRDRKDLKQSGVYFLFGIDENNKESVYIGQAGIRKNGEGVLFRVVEHLKDAFYFNEAVMLTTQNNSFGPTEISYLENCFTNLAKSIDRYNVINANDPNPGNVTEEKESELEEFVEYSKIVLGVLGYKIFVPLIEIEDSDKNENEKELYLYIKQNSRKYSEEIEAKCKRTNEGFVVLKGSNMKKNIVKSAPKAIKEIRDKLIENGDVKNGVLMKNQLFTSPSYAASFILGSSVNGRMVWKTKEGIALGEMEEKSL